MPTVGASFWSCKSIVTLCWIKHEVQLQEAASPSPQPPAHALCQD